MEIRTLLSHLFYHGYVDTRSAPLAFLCRESTSYQMIPGEKGPHNAQHFIAPEPVLTCQLDA